MISKGDRILVALSGGKDSVALINALCEFSAKMEFSICAFHLNHSIRGVEADRDEEFCGKLCKSLNVEFVSRKIDIPKIAKEQGIGIEECARNERYKQLSFVMKELKCNKIATAHTASDNSETVLMSIARNHNGIGIPPVRDNIIRPLIECSSNDVVGYLELNNLECVYDSTNADIDISRNFMRNEVLTKIYEKYPNFDDSVTIFSNISRNSVSLCEYLYDDYKKKYEPLSKTGLQFLAKDKRLTNLLYFVLSKEAEITYRQFVDIIELIKKWKVNSEINVSNNTSFVLQYESAIFEKNTKSTPVNFEFRIKYGKNEIPGENFVLYLENKKDYNDRIRVENTGKTSKVNNLSKNIIFKSNIINSTLIARSRKTGDSYLCGDINRNIKKFMIDIKIDAKKRSQIPIVCDEEGIVWVPGLGICDRLRDYRANKDDEDYYSLSLDIIS